MGKIIFSILVYCSTFTIYATEYYISSSTGNDSNDGNSPDTAWKTLSKIEIERNNFLPGDIIAFKRGDIWNDGSFLNLSGVKGRKEKYIHFTSFGEGHKPIISVVGKPNATWVYQGGNIWRSSSFHDQISRVMIDDKEVLGSWIYSELNTNIGDSRKVPSSIVKFVWDNIGDGYFVYLYSSVNPSKINIKVSLDVRALSLYDNSFLIVSDIEFQGGYHGGITVKACNNIIFDNIKIGVMSRHGLSTAYSNIINKHSKNITVKNSLFDTEFTLDYSSAQKNNKRSEQHGGSDGLALRDCIGAKIFNNTFKNWGHSSLSLTATNDDISETTLVKAYNNYLTSPDIAYGGRFGGDRNTHHNEIYNNIIENIKTSCQMNGFSNHVHHNIFRNNKHTPLKKYSYGELTVQGYSTSSYNNIFENNLFMDCENTGYFVGGDNDSSDVTGHIFKNNIIYNCGSYYANIGIWIETNSNSTYSNRGNIIQNNIIYNSATTKTIRYYKDIITVAAFNKQSSYGHTIENILDRNPYFVSASDYHLKDNSPAINAGITSLSTKDYDGNPIPNDGTLPDIGIYEFYKNTTGSIKANAGSDQMICFGESVTLTASGGSSYSWNTGATTKSITVNPTETTTYSVTVSEGSASDSDSVQVTVNNVTAEAGENQTINEGESVTLTASGGDSYVWNTGATTQSITVTPAATTIYTIIAKKGYCEDTDTVQVTVNTKDTSPPPAKANAGEDQTICLGDHIKLTASGGLTYVWSTGAISKSISVNPTRTTSYTVTATRGGVTNSDVVVVTVENCSAISDSEQQEELHIYPNPTSGIINISVKNVNKEFSLFVTDAKGSIVYREEEMSKNNDFYKKMDLSDFDRGVYFVGLNGTNINEVKKLLVVDK